MISNHISRQLRPSALIALLDEQRTTFSIDAYILFLNQKPSFLNTNLNAVNGSFVA